jgi:hypothetical protein
MLALQPSAFAWGSKGHEMVNWLAWKHLPRELPAFLRSATVGDEIEFLGPEPDRWRSPQEPELASEQGPEHFINLELADRIGPLPRQRWQFVHALYGYGERNPDEAAQMLPEKVGLQPWQATEVEERLQAAFRTWREEKAKHRDTRPVEASIIFYMGWLGHYVADGSQPLHTSIHYNGWVGTNPHGYTTVHSIHSIFETDFVNANIDEDDLKGRIKKPQSLADVFEDYVAYLRQSNALVEKTYQLEKAGGFEGKGSSESRKFTEDRLAAAVTMLDSLWLTAWENSAKPDARLESK